MKNGWKLAFKFEEGANVIDLELIGDADAIRVGLGLAGLMLGQKIQQRLIAGNLPDGLLADASLLYAIQTGTLTPRAHEGVFLKIEPVKIAGGLQQNITVEWSD